MEMDKTESLAKAIMNLNSPADWENIAPAYREMWRKKASLVHGLIKEDGFHITER